MTSREFKLVVGVVVAIAVLQIAMEDGLLFLATTDAPVPAWLNSRYAMMVMPFTLLLVLFVVLFGAVVFADRDRDPPGF
ncbi:MAG: hypothetical protein ABEJ57_03720 [Halobacteriaceae archaeon]